MTVLTRSLGVTLAALLLVSLTGCNTNFNQGGDDPAADKDANLAEIDKSLEGNLYIEAAAQAGEGSNSCEVTKGADETLNLAFSIEGLSHPFLVAQVAAAEAAAKEVNATMTVLSGDDDVNTQLTGIETELGKSPDGLLLMPATTEGLQPILQTYTDAKIPYAFTGKGMTGVDPAVQFLAPYGEEGKKLGEFVVDHYKDQDGPIKVAVISGISGDVSSVARTQTFKRELIESGKFEIVAEQAGEYRRQPSQDAMDAILAAHPDVQLAFAANDDGALGVLDAIKSAGKAGEIDVVGIDGQPDMFPAIESGDALATVIHLPSAGEATKLLASCIRGEEVPAFQVMVGELVTKESIDAGAKPAW